MLTMTNIDSKTAAMILTAKLATAKKIAADIDIIADELLAAPADMLPALPIATDGSVLISDTRLALSVMGGSWTTTRYTNERCGTGALRLRVTGIVNGVSLEGYVEIKNGFAYDSKDRTKIVGRKLFAVVNMDRDNRASASDAARAKIRVAMENCLIDAGLTCEDLDSVGITKTAINEVRSLVYDMKTYVHASKADRAIAALTAPAVI
jgi:hypothetical protein